MIKTLPERCPRCGSEDLHTAVSVVNSEDKKIASVTCNNCDSSVADRERLNYKPAVKPDNE